MTFREKAENDLYFFCKEVLGYADLTDLHRGMCDQVADPDVSSWLGLYPRGHFKSTIVSKGFPLWVLVRDRNMRIGLFNWSETLVHGFLREVKSHIERNPILNRYWPGMKPEKPDVWNYEAIQIARSMVDSTPSMQALSLQANTVGAHHDLHIYDDIVNADSVQTIDSIEKTHARFIDLDAILNPPVPGRPYTGCRRMIGTRWHWSDEYNRISEEQSEDWTITIRKAIENGVPIFPEKFNSELLAKKRRQMGGWHFSAQYMNDPVDEEHAAFPPRFIKIFTKDPNTLFDSTPVYKYIAVDPAWSTEGGEDHWGIVCGGMFDDGRVLISEVLKTRDKPAAVCEAICVLAARWRPHKIAFESDGGQYYLFEQLKKTLEKHNLQVSVQGLSHMNQKKETRILSLQPPFEQGRIMLHESCTDLYNQLVRFPRDSQRDLVDALEMFMRIATPPNAGGSYESKVERGSGLWEMKQMVDRRKKGNQKKSLFQRMKGAK